MPARYDRHVEIARHQLDAADYALGTADESFTPSACDAELYLMQAQAHALVALADAVHRIALSKGAH